MRVYHPAFKNERENVRKKFKTILAAPVHVALWLGGHHGMLSRTPAGGTRTTGVSVVVDDETPPSTRLGSLQVSFLEIRPLQQCAHRQQLE